MQKDYTGAARLMARGAGRFMRAIADAWICADPDNRAILEDAFRAKFDQYQANYERLHGDGEV